MPICSERVEFLSCNFWEHDKSNKTEHINLKRSQERHKCPKCFWTHSANYTLTSYVSETISALCLRLFAMIVVSTLVRSRRHPPPNFRLADSVLLQLFHGVSSLSRVGFHLPVRRCSCSTEWMSRPLKTSWCASSWRALRWYHDAIDFGSTEEVLCQDPGVCTVLLFKVSTHLSEMVIDCDTRS